MDPGGTALKSGSQGECGVLFPIPCVGKELPAVGVVSCASASKTPLNASRISAARARRYSSEVAERASVTWVIALRKAVSASQEQERSVSSTVAMKAASASISAWPLSTAYSGAGSSPDAFARTESSRFCSEARAYESALRKRAISCDGGRRRDPPGRERVDSRVSKQKTGPMAHPAEAIMPVIGGMVRMALSIADPPKKRKDAPVCALHKTLTIPVGRAYTQALYTEV